MDLSNFEENKKVIDSYFYELFIGLIKHEINVQVVNIRYHERQKLRTLIGYGALKYRLGLYRSGRILFATTYKKCSTKNLKQCKKKIYNPENGILMKKYERLFSMNNINIYKTFTISSSTA